MSGFARQFGEDLDAELGRIERRCIEEAMALNERCDSIHGVVTKHEGEILELMDRISRLEKSVPPRPAPQEEPEDPQEEPAPQPAVDTSWPDEWPKMREIDPPQVSGEPIQLTGGEVKLESGKIYTGWCRRVYASKAHDVVLRDLVVDAEGGQNAVRLVGKVERIYMDRCEFRNALVNVDMEARQEGDFVRDIVLHDCDIKNASDPGSGHSQGLYAYNVDGLLVRMCGFYHNGLMRSDPDLMAHDLIYNHSIYLSHCRDVKIRKNIIDDSASFAIKLRSDAPRGVQRVLVADNIIRGGANGISVGTNKKDETPQFQHLVIARNVFHHLGRNIAGNPQSIGIDIHSVDGGRVLGNSFYGKALKTPHYAILVRDYPQADLVVAGNWTKGWDKTFKFERTEGVTQHDNTAE